ncbi:MAG TPA: DUF6526 family protein [Terriglobales bacterium]
MSSNAEQNLANHARLDPLFHFLVLPVFLISFVSAVVSAVKRPDLHSVWFAIAMLAVVVAAFKIRMYALKVQDRLIRLEERERLAALVPEVERAQILRLTVGQLVALRFASDGEAAGLARRAWTENMKPADIKKAIKGWRPDHFRV